MLIKERKIIMKIEYESPVMEVFSFEIKDNLMDTSECSTGYSGATGCDSFTCFSCYTVTGCPADGVNLS